MKKITLLWCVAVACGLSACQLQPTRSNLLLELEHPERNVLCDQYFCANAQGVSQALTEKYLGEGQANRVFSQGAFNLTQFTFANGVFCDTQEQMCYSDRYFDSDGKRSQKALNYSQALFAQ